MRFRVKLQKAGNLDSTFIAVPFGARGAFEKSGLVKVAGKIDNLPFHSSLFPASDSLGRPELGGLHFMAISRQIRTALGKTIGDTVVVEMRADKSHRAAGTPADLKGYLRYHGLWQVFRDSPLTRQKELIRSVLAAKRPDTKARRLKKILAELTVRPNA